MNKWGIRLVGYYFFVRAILTAYRLILSPSYAGGFFGIHTNISYSLPFLGNGDAINLMAMGEVIALSLIGYFLLRFNSSARLAALLVLWPPTIYYGIYFLLMTLAAISSFFDPETKASATLTFFQWSQKINDPIILALAFTGFFLFYFIPTYLLMKKDTKALFQKVIPAGETN